jgi:hypothetical protein
VEAAIVLPLIIVLVILSIDFCRIAFARIAVRHALDQGMRVAQSDERLGVNVLALPPNNPQYEAFTTARNDLASVVHRTLELHPEISPHFR